MFAVKIIRSGDQEIIKSIEKDFKIVKDLDNPGIIKAYDLYIDLNREITYYIMEYVKGCTLKKVLRKKRVLEEKKVA